MPFDRRRHIAITGGAVMMLCAALLARQAPSAGQDAAKKTPQAIVPVAASTLASSPDAYVGATVSMTGVVDAPVGASAFTVHQGSAVNRGGDVLVLAPILIAPVSANGEVTVIGDVIRFDAATVAARMKSDLPSLPPGIAEQFRGKPTIIATSVINHAMVDLAKRPPAPMTPEEQAVDALMKQQVSPAFAALRQAVAKPDLPETAVQAAALSKAFAASAAFWHAKAAADAVQFGIDAQHAADAVAAAAAKGDADAVKAAVPQLQQTCTNCHGAHRDRMDDGTYRWKAGASR